MDFIEEMIVESHKNSIGEIWEEDHKRSLFAWRNADSNEEKKRVLNDYVDLLVTERKYAQSQLMQFVRSVLEEEERKER